MNFLEALAAIPRPIPTQQMRECPDCHGTGERGYGRLIGPEESQHYRLCEDCDGEGEVAVLCAECEAPKMNPTAGCDCDSRWWCDSCVANDCAPMAAYDKESLTCVRCGTTTSDGTLCTECQVEEAEGQWEPHQFSSHDPMPSGPSMAEIHATKNGKD